MLGCSPFVQLLLELEDIHRVRKVGVELCEDGRTALQRQIRRELPGVDRQTDTSLSVVGGQSRGDRGSVQSRGGSGTSRSMFVSMAWTARLTKKSNDVGTSTVGV